MKTKNYVNFSAQKKEIHLFRIFLHGSLDEVMKDVSLYFII